MDKLSQAIIAMEVHFADKEPRLRAQWETISTVLAEGQKPTNNKQSAPLSSKCIGCGAIIDNVYCDDCRRRLAS